MLTGWDELDAAFLERHRAVLDADDLERFWDGAQPQWRHALAPTHQVPAREVVADAAAVLDDPSAATVVLLVGPAGQGKSTAVRQVAAALAASPNRRVLFRLPGGSLDPDAVQGLPGDTAWVLASDDADEIASAVVRAAEGLAAAGQAHVHWILAARDKDWERQFPRREPWEGLVVEWPERAARAQALAVTDHDASVIAAAWGGHGEGPVVASAPTLLAGVLRSRITDLAGHVQGRLAALDPASRSAFLSAAAADAVGIDGVDLRVMADLTGTSRHDRFALRTSLGAAGLGTGTAEALRTRDPSLALAAVLGLEDDQVRAVYTELVRATAQAARQTRPLVSDGAIVMGAPTLATRLVTLGIAEGTAHEIACATADAAAEALDNLLMTALFRSRTYRAAGAPEKADTVLRAAMASATATDDWAETARSFVSELSLTTSTPEAAIVVDGLSLADLRGLGPVAMVDARAPLARIGERCSILLDGGDPYERLLRAVGWLGRRVTPNFDPVKQDFRRYAARADELGVDDCSAAEAVQWLGEGIATAFATVDDPDIDDLLALVLPDGSLAFMQLHRTASRGANLVG